MQLDASSSTSRARFLTSQTTTDNNPMMAQQSDLCCKTLSNLLRGGHTAMMVTTLLAQLFRWQCTKNHRCYHGAGRKKTSCGDMWALAILPWQRSCWGRMLCSRPAVTAKAVFSAAAASFGKTQWVNFSIQTSEAQFSNVDFALVQTQELGDLWITSFHGLLASSPSTS